MRKGTESQRKKHAPAHQESSTKYQDIKEFKCQIDHEIAKCLDTIDRQGLKFLKETMRASKLFALNTQELKYQDSPPAKKPQTVVRPQVQVEKQKKVLSSRGSTRNDTKNNLGNRLNKELQKLNIKTGKRQIPKIDKSKARLEQKNTEGSKKQVEQGIEEDIRVEEEVEELIEQVAGQNESSCKEESMVEQRILAVPSSSLQTVRAQLPTAPVTIEPIPQQKHVSKPFSRHQLKRVPTQPKVETGVPLEASIIQKQTLPTKQDDVKNLQKSQEQQSNQSQVSSKQAILNLVERMKKLSPAQLQQVEQVIENIDHQQTGQGIATPNPKTPSYIKPQIQWSRQSEKRERSRSRTKRHKERQEKATSIASSIKGSMVRKQHASMVPLSGSHIQPDRESLEVANEQPQSLKVEVTESAVVSESASKIKEQNAPKMIKLGRKKMTSSVKLVVKSNRGHGSMVGLTCFEIYSAYGNKIIVSSKQVKGGGRAMRLVEGEGWLVALKDAWINIEAINEPIAGLRVINWNKSELDSDKQAMDAQIQINGEMVWEGQLKSGSFSPNAVYNTDVQLSPQFSFPQISVPKLFPAEQLSIKAKEKQGHWLDTGIGPDLLKYALKEPQEQKQVKRAQKVRSTAELSHQNKQYPVLVQSPSRVKNDKKYTPQLLSNKKEKSAVNLLDTQDILGALNEGVGIKKKTAKPLKNETTKESQAKREKEQDAQFQKILESIGEGKAEVKENPKPAERHSYQPHKARNMAQQDFDDFMKDSLFDDKPRVKAPSEQKPTFTSPKNREANEKEGTFLKKDKGREVELDCLIDQLNDMVGNSREAEDFEIPELPSGQLVSVILVSNWGNSQLVGLNGVQLFDKGGQRIRPESIFCSGAQAADLWGKLLKEESDLLTSDQRKQMTWKKGKVAINITLAHPTTISAIRLWNYNGRRVHKDIGVKKCHIKLDNNYIFSGQIGQSANSHEDPLKNCEIILTTSSNRIIDQLQKKDWISQVTHTQQKDTQLFRTTLEHFHRPPTKNQNSNQQVLQSNEKRTAVKYPKKNCFEYDSPLLPQGFVLKFVLHSSWGDQFFIGLNGIEVFSSKGHNLTKKDLKKINAQPSWIGSLKGYEGDQRVVENVVNGVNSSTANQHTWLTPLLSDVDKIQQSRSNTLSLQYSSPTQVSGINFYNYSKNPQRGVRQIEIFMDNTLIYRGYLQRYGAEPGASYTTVAFTREQALLEVMGFNGYHEDSMEQQVGMVDEGKVLKARVTSNQQQNRPLTGKQMT